MFKLFIFFITAVSTPVFGTSLSQLFQDAETFNPDKYKLGIDQPVLINDRILFAGRSPNGNALWALDINTLEKIELLRGYGNNGRVNFQRLADQIFFQFVADDSFVEEIWQSDGTVEGTRVFFSSDAIFPALFLKQADGVFYSKNGNELLVSDGARAIIHPLDPLYNEGLCAFSAENIVIFNNIDESPQYRWSNGNEVVQLDLNQSQTNANFSTDVIKYDGACYFIAPLSDADDGVGIWKINDEGQVSLVNTPADLGNNITQIVVHQGSMYATSRPGGNSFDEDNVFLLNSDLSAINASYGSYYPATIASSGTYLSARFSAPTSPPTFAISFLTTDLQVVTTLSGAGSSQNSSKTPLFYQNSEQWLMADPYFFGQNDDIKSLLFSPFSSAQLTLPLPEVESQFFIVSEDSDRVFITSYDKGRRGTLSEVVSSPKINSLIDGSWIEPNIENQGLMLRTGKRQDGSEYLVATVYTYNNGEQMWLAGNKNIETNMDAIELDLFAYSGLDFFEAGLDAEATPFGRIELRLTSCNRLDMQLNTPIGTENHSMYRIDDTTATRYCVDQ